MSIQGFVKPRARILDVLLVFGNQLRRQHDIGMSGTLQLALNICFDSIPNKPNAMVVLRPSKDDGELEYNSSKTADMPHSSRMLSPLKTIRPFSFQESRLNSAPLTETITMSEAKCERNWMFAETRREHQPFTESEIQSKYWH